MNFITSYFIPVTATTIIEYLHYYSSYKMTNIDASYFKFNLKIIEEMIMNYFMESNKDSDNITIIIANFVIIICKRHCSFL